MQNNRPKQLFVFLLLMVIVVSKVNGQLPAYHVQFFDEDHGIRTGNYQRLEMTKDSANFLWLLQTNTIQRFDGNQVVEFRFDETLISILCDGQGRVWVTSDTKVAGSSVASAKIASKSNGFSSVGWFSIFTDVGGCRFNPV